MDAAMMVTAGSTTLHIASCIVSPEFLLGNDQTRDGEGFVRVLTHVFRINRGKFRALDKRSNASTSEHDNVRTTVEEDVYNLGKVEMPCSDLQDTHAHRDDAAHLLLELQVQR